MSSSVAEGRGSVTRPGGAAGNGLMRRGKSTEVSAIILATFH